MFSSYLFTYLAVDSNTAYKINIKKEKMNDVSTVRRSFSKLACFLLLNLKMTVEWSKRCYSFSTVTFYSEIRFENLISAFDAKSRLKIRDLDL